MGPVHYQNNDEQEAEDSEEYERCDTATKALSPKVPTRSPTVAHPYPSVGSYSNQDQQADERREQSQENQSPSPPVILYLPLPELITVP